MAAGKPLEIQCPGCGRETILRREPKYDGFKKVGERLFCASCKHEFESEDEAPVRGRKVASIFSDDDRPKKLDIFKDEEDIRNCRHCEHHVVNPFLQRCGLHKKPVEATDSCRDFQNRPEPPADEEDTEEPGQPVL